MNFRILPVVRAVCPVLARSSSLVSRGVLALLSDNQLWRIGPLTAARRGGWGRLGHNQMLMLFHTLDALKVEKTCPVSQSVKTQSKMKAYACDGLDPV